MGLSQQKGYFFRGRFGIFKDGYFYTLNNDASQKGASG